MKLVISSAPAAEPVLLADLKTHLRVDSTAEDSLITSLETAAREIVEARTGRALISQTWKLYLDSFPTKIVLPKPPLSSVSSIKYYDLAGTQQTLSSSAYTVITQSEPGEIVEAYGYTWPSTRDIPNAVEVIFICGYGAAGTSVPASLLTAIRLLAATWFENRESVNVGNIVNEIPLAAEMLMRQYEVPTLA